MVRGTVLWIFSKVRAMNQESPGFSHGECQSKSYLKNFYSGHKELTDDIKSSYRHKDNLDSLVNFYFTSIDEECAINVLIKFGIPEKAVPNKKALAVALAKQTRTIFNSDDVEAENILGIEYQKAKTETEIPTSATITRKLYPGDDIYVDFKPARLYEVGSWDIVHHTWTLQNCGKISWINRRLVYRRGVKDRPEAEPSVIEIPLTKPNEFVHLDAVFCGRGFDAVTRCIWDMLDEDGENCFPNQDGLFSITIDAKYKR